VEVILNYIQEDMKVDDFKSLEHAWAEAPKTIGSISMMFLGYMIMRELSPEELGYQYQETTIQNNINLIL